MNAPPSAPPPPARATQAVKAVDPYAGTFGKGVAKLPYYDTHARQQMALHLQAAARAQAFEPYAAQLPPSDPSASHHVPFERELPAPRGGAPHPRSCAAEHDAYSNAHFGHPPDTDERQYRRRPRDERRYSAEDDDRPYSSYDGRASSHDDDYRRAPNGHYRYLDDRPRYEDDYNHRRAYDDADREYSREHSRRDAEERERWSEGSARRQWDDEDRGKLGRYENGNNYGVLLSEDRRQSANRGERFDDYGGDQMRDDDDHGYHEGYESLPASFGKRRGHGGGDGRRPTRARTGNTNDKYYKQRYRLFKRFDDGIRLDKVSWYSATPEAIAAHIARRTAAKLPPNPTVVDPFCGAAGNVIQFAMVGGANVIAVELDASRLALGKHNAAVYEVGGWVDWIHGNAFHVLPALKANAVDAVFLSPPWGGPEYLNAEVYDLGEFAEIMRIARAVVPNVAILVPRNVSWEQALELFGECEVELNMVGEAHRPKTVTIYFGELIRTRTTKESGPTRTYLDDDGYEVGDNADDEGDAESGGSGVPNGTTVGDGEGKRSVEAGDSRGVLPNGSAAAKGEEAQSCAEAQPAMAPVAGEVGDATSAAPNGVVAKKADGGKAMGEAPLANGGSDEASNHGSTAPAPAGDLPEKFGGDGEEKQSSGDNATESNHAGTAPEPVPAGNVGSAPNDGDLPKNAGGEGEERANADGCTKTTKADVGNVEILENKMVAS